MRKVLGASLLLAGLMLVVDRAEARGKRSGCGGYATTSAGWEGYAAPYCAEVSYAEQTVTAYRSEVRTRTVERTVTRVVPKQVAEGYTYPELVAVTTPQT